MLPEMDANPTVPTFGSRLFPAPSNQNFPNAEVRVMFVMNDPLVPASV